MNCHLSIRRIIVYVSFVVSCFPAIAGDYNWTLKVDIVEHFEDALVHPTHQNRIYLGANDVWFLPRYEGGLFYTDDGGDSWRMLGFMSSSVYNIEYDHNNPEILWLSNDENGVFRSIDGGETWESRNTGLFLGGDLNDYVDQVRVSPHDGGRLVCTTSNDVSDGRFYHSSDSGATWNVEIDTIGLGFKHFLAYDPSAAGSLFYTTGSPGYIYHSLDYGENLFLRGTHFRSLVWDLLVCPDQTNEVWVCTADSLCKSVDGGESWASFTDFFYMTEDSFCWDIDMLGAGDTIIAATTDVPYVSFDGGSNFIRLDSNATFPSASRVEVVNRNPLTLWAYGWQFSGIYEYVFADTTDSANSDERLANERSESTDFDIFPNPTTGIFEIRRPTGIDTRMELVVYDLLGRRITAAQIREFASNSVIQLPNTLPNGVYFVAATTAGRELKGRPRVQKLIMTR